MLWTDKYRPQSFAQVVGYNKEKQIIQKWIADWKASNPQKPLLLIGPPGIGTTTFALIIAMQVTNVPRMPSKAQLANHPHPDLFLAKNTN